MLIKVNKHESSRCWRIYGNAYFRNDFRDRQRLVDERAATGGKETVPDDLIAGDRRVGQRGAPADLRRDVGAVDDKTVLEVGRLFGNTRYWQTTLYVQLYVCYNYLDYMNKRVNR